VWTKQPLQSLERVRNLAINPQDGGGIAGAAQQVALDSTHVKAAGKGALGAASFKRLSISYPDRG
jgi:hypothetical protein